MLSDEMPDIEDDPGWAPEAISSIAPIVYLDQWCFDHLAWDRAGKPKEESERGLFERFHEWAKSGSVVFPLGETHYRENWARLHEGPRWDTALTMGLLSGFNTLGVSQLDVWDAAVGLRRFHGTEFDFETPAVLGWGFMHCIRSKESRAKIVDTTTGRQADWSQLGADVVNRMANLEDMLAYRQELAILALGDPAFSDVDGFEPFEPVPDPSGESFLAEERRIREAIEEYGRTERVVRNTLGFATLSSSSEWILRAEIALGLPANGTILGLADLVPNRRVLELDRLISGMPIQSTFTNLRTHSHLIKSWRGSRSDLRDFIAMATALPFVDLFVADKKTCNLAHRALSDDQSQKVVRRLSDVASWLETHITHQ